MQAAVRVTCSKCKKAFVGCSSTLLQRSNPSPQFTQSASYASRKWGHGPSIPRPKKLPYRGLYKTDGDRVIKNQTLVVQYLLNYHPGLNVRHEQIDKDRFLKAMCDGTVIISREEVHLNFDDPLIEQLYGFKKGLPIYKLTYNVLPDEEIGNFRLVDSI